jgi:hypothetical protein
VSEASTRPAVPSPNEEDLDRLAAAAPPMIGTEYLTASASRHAFRRLLAAFDDGAQQVRLPPIRK